MTSFVIVPVQQAVADTSPIESLSTSNLPGNYLSGDNWSLNGSACGSESCVSVGSYEFVGPPSSRTHGLIVPISDGIAGAGVQLPLPQGAQTDSTQNDQLTGVSCWSASSCVAVGDYYDSSGNLEGVVIPVVNGVVGAPQEVQAPGAGAPDPAGTDPYMLLQAVSCTASGACVAVGSYSPALGGGQEAMEVPINDGVADPGIEVPAPSDSASPPYVELLSISCQASGTCVAVGDYYAGSGSGTDVALVVPISAGVPQSAAPMTGLPVNADSTQGAGLTNIACSAGGTCTAIGYYYDSSGNQRDLVVRITDGAAAAGAEAPAPADGTGTNPFSIQFNGLACQSTGACLAAGSYDTAAGTQPVAIPITAGVPAAAARIALPTDAEPSGQFAELSSVACPVTGPCLTVGDYRNLTGNSVPMTASFSNGGIGAGVETAEPADESTAGNAFAVLDTIGCTTFSCAATGSYSNATTDAPFVLSAQAPLAISPTNLPSGTVGSAYSQTLSGMGAWGVYSNWSVTSGSLPAGLSLNVQTGVISGTPAAVGTSTFSVQLGSTTGVPLQTATQSYSLQIAASPPTATPPSPTPPTQSGPVPPVATPATAKLALVTHSVAVSKNKFSLKLSCSAAPCHGSLKLQISETVTVKRSKKRVRKHEIVAIGNAGFSLAAGQTTPIRVTINALGRRALAARHRLSATVLDTVGGVKGTLGNVTLTAAPVKHRK